VVADVVESVPLVGADAVFVPEADVPDAVPDAAAMLPVNSVDDSEAEEVAPDPSTEVAPVPLAEVFPEVAVPEAVFPPSVDGEPDVPPLSTAPTGTMPPGTWVGWALVSCAGAGVVGTGVG
jgi:hypothetical protein